ncbi:hypothetical protein FOXB_03048, partial [Fusarium oxysporum f. sp. conglutinans Fo5176]
MGPVKESPFYAMKIFPGDAGTRGGLLTDEFARVLGKSGIAIPGLFAGGNASVALLESQGAGTTLAPAMTEGFIAVNKLIVGSFCGVISGNLPGAAHANISTVRSQIDAIPGLEDCYALAILPDGQLTVDEGQSASSLAEPSAPDGPGPESALVP